MRRIRRRWRRREWRRVVRWTSVDLRSRYEGDPQKRAAVAPSAAVEAAQPTLLPRGNATPGALTSSPLQRAGALDSGSSCMPLFTRVHRGRL
jgi:hypothetical protein